MQQLHPPNWAQPKGYSHGIKADGPFIFVAGQIGWDGDQNFTGETLAERVRQALENVVAVLDEGGSTPDQIVRMTWYVTDKKEYEDAQREIGEAYQAVIGDHYPAMTLFQVDELLEDEAKVEIEVTATAPKSATKSLSD